MAVDPVLQAMWHAHSKQQQRVRFLLTVIVWTIVISAALSLIGGFIWYSKVAGGMAGGFY